MLTLALVVLAAACTIGLCVYNYTLHRRIRNRNTQKVNFIRKASEYSTIASSTVNPMIALINVTRAQQMLEVLHEMYSIDEIREMIGVDSEEFLHSVTEQSQKILRDIMKDNVAYTMKDNPLASQAGFTAPDKEEDDRWSSSEEGEASSTDDDEDYRRRR